ncbi:hypothetical protein [Afipia sp. P52-10]|nr:hypothetical protein [Afipia sp. P52-10]
MADTSDKYDDRESQKRFDAALKGALKTPHKPLKEKPPAKRPKAKKKAAK